MGVSGTGKKTDYTISSKPEWLKYTMTDDYSIYISDPFRDPGALNKFNESAGKM